LAHAWPGTDQAWAWVGFWLLEIPGYWRLLSALLTKRRSGTESMYTELLMQTAMDGLFD